MPPPTTPYRAASIIWDGERFVAKIFNEPVPHIARQMVLSLETALEAAGVLGTCPGHPAGEYDPMGETVYCDGSCQKGE